jgi:hypothetical protein
LIFRAGLLATICILFVLFSGFTAFPADSYPQVDVTGYKQYTYNSLNVDEIQNLFQAQAMLGGYYAGGPWQERLKLNIIGKLTEKLSVSYDLEQEPDMPDKFDVNVTYDKTNLTFGDIQANFGENEFTSASKSLNGVMITSKDTWYNLLLVPSSKLQSDTQALVSQRGNNTKGPYNLGHGSIIEGSERIQLNNNLLTRGPDYTIDYFNGTITFSKILTPYDEFNYSFEFTNLMDQFFPTVSKRDFVGVQGSITVNPALLGVSEKKPEKSIKQSMEIFPTRLNASPEVTVRLVSSETISLPSKLPVSLEAASMLITPESLVAPAKIPGTQEAANGTSTPETQAKNAASQEAANGTASLTTEAANVIATPEAGPKEYEWESTGNYRLQNIPVIPYSEKLTYSGILLKRLEDYIINYQDGTITLLRPKLPTMADPLIVEYQYVEVTQEAETLHGSGKGPYTLSFNNIVEESELVSVNSIPYFRELDYKIDYDLGKIMFFADIPQTANIVVKYKHIVTTTPPPSPAPAVPRNLNIGVSYLKESGSRAATPPSVAATDTKSGSDILNNNNTIYLSFMPVTTTGEVEVRKDNVVQVNGVDYVFPTVEASTGNVIPDTKLAYRCDPADTSGGLSTGTIKFLGPLSTTDEVTISYNYYKWSSDRYSGSGLSSTRGYYLGGFRGLVPGTEQVQIWRKDLPNPTIHILTRNSGVGVYDGHYSMNYSDPPAITFNNDPIVVDGETFYLKDINFTVILKFVAQSSASDSPISHDVVGSDFSLQVGDYLNLGAAYARSKTDQVYTTASTNETYHGNGVTKVFNLNSPDTIIDGSEQVYLNGQKLNRDNQYSFFYDANSSGKYGVLSFFLITPASADVISIDYNYQSTAGVVSSVTEKQGSAYSFTGDIKPTSNVEFAADYKKVDADFAPMGGTSIPIGSDYEHAYTKITPFPSFWSSFWFSGDSKTTNTPINNYPDKFLHAYDRNLATGFNPEGLAQVDFNLREYDTMDDLLPGIHVHNNDYKSLAYSLSVVPNSLHLGEFGFTNTNDARKTLSYTDTEDKVLPQDTTNDYYHTNNTFDLTRRVKWILDYQVNQSSTISYESGSRSKGTTILRQETDDLSSNLNWDLTFGGIKKLYTYWNKIGHDQYDLILGSSQSTVNETYHADFVPIDQIVTSVDHNRQETPTVTTAFGNPMSERSAADIRITPYSTTAFGWSGSIDNSLLENGVRTSGNANTYSINHTALSGSNYKLTAKYNLATSLNKGPSGTAEVTTDTRTFDQDYDLTLSPTSIWSITTGIGQEDYINKNDDPIAPIDTKSQAQTTTVGTTYKAMDTLDLSGNYSVKVTSTPDQSAHKSVVDAHAIYRVFTYGTANYDWSQEDNGGEILGGSFVEQDFTKIIQSLSVNIVVPQSGQMILSSIVLKAAVKWANYQDRITPANSFQATLLSFEGTFNF